MPSLSIYLSINPSLYLSIYLSVYLSIYIPVYLYACTILDSKVMARMWGVHSIYAWCLIGVSFHRGFITFLKFHLWTKFPPLNEFVCLINLKFFLWRKKPAHERLIPLFLLRALVAGAALEACAWTMGYDPAISWIKWPHSTPNWDFFAFFMPRSSISEG